MKKRIFTLILTAAVMMSVFSLNTLAAEELNLPTASVTPIIDGEVNSGEWQGAMEISLASVDIVQMIAGVPTSLIKKGSAFYMMWDDSYIYCAAHVIDTTKSSVNPDPYDTSTSGLGDGLQLVFFANGESQWAQGASDVLMWNIMPWVGSTREPAMFEHFHYGMYESETKIASTHRDDGYDVEFAIPWTAFSEAAADGFKTEFTPEAGTEMYFFLAVLDADSGGKQNMSLTADAWGGAMYSDKLTLTYDDAGGDYSSDTTASDTTAASAGTSAGDNTTTVSGTAESSDVSDTTAADTAEEPAPAKNSTPLIIGIIAAVAVVAAVVFVVIKKKKS